MSEHHTGGCQCGQVRYTIAGPLPAAYACHCTDCKQQSASAFAMSMPLSCDRLLVTGTLRRFEKVADSGKPKFAWFCPECGTRLWHGKADPPEWITLKVGSLDNGRMIEPRGHLWVARLQPGIMLDPLVPQFQTQPDDLDGWRRALT